MSIAVYNFDNLQIGDYAEIKKQISLQDILNFSKISGDYNAVHTDATCAKKAGFTDITAQGMWCGLLASAILGTKFPGSGTVYLEQQLKFCHPIYAGDTITTRATIISKQEYICKVTLEFKFLNQHNKLIATGTAKIIAPK